MLRHLNQVFDLFRLKLGRCSRCMRTAFAAAATAIILAGSATIFLAPIYAAAAWAIALGFVALWIAHVWVFTARSVHATAVRDSGGAIAAQQAALWPRRRVLAAFVRLLVFSAVVGFSPRNAMAQGCNCYNEADCYCPPDFPNCVFNPTTGEAICCGPNSPGCAGPQQTWCCPPGTNCYGTEGQCYGGN
jgi:hypothetical protein